MGSITRSFANNITTAGKFDGTKLTGDIPEANLSANAPAFDDNKIVNDLSTLGLRVHTQENLNASNTNSQYVDVFNDDSGFTNGTNTSRNSSEYVSSSTTSVTIGGSDAGFTTGDNYWTTVSDFKLTSNDGAAGGWNSNSNNLHDGATGNNSSDSTWPATTNTDSVYFDVTPSSTYQAGGSKVISGFRFMVASRNQSSDFSVAGSNTLGGTYTTLGSGTMGTGGDYDATWVPTQTYDYYRVTFPNGVNTSGYWKELYGNSRTISSSTSLNATGNFLCPAITAASSTTKIGAVITYQDTSGTNALNTDIVLQLSADNGSNFSTATLTALPDFSSGIKMAKVNDLAVTAGTQLKYKISFANQASGSKEARIRGVSLNY